jgi:hypothetical protein
MEKAGNTNNEGLCIEEYVCRPLEGKHGRCECQRRPPFHISGNGKDVCT